MILETISITIAVILLIIGSYTDLRTREVPDYINYGAMFFGAGIHILYAIIISNYMPLLECAAGFLAGLAVGLLMFYTGQWGGGDSKMIMALGAIIGVQFTFSPIPLLLIFFVYMMFAGAGYGVIWSVFIAISKRKIFLKQWRKEAKDPLIAKMRYVILAIFAIIVIGIIFTQDTITRIILFLMIFMIGLLFYTYLFVKAVEVCMFKIVKPSELTEGDWIVNDIRYNGKYITGPKDLGISKVNIAKLVKLQKQGKMKKVLIKNGIPFVPSFLIAMVLALLLGNLITLIA